MAQPEITHAADSGVVDDDASVNETGNTKTGLNRTVFRNKLVCCSDHPKKEAEMFCTSCRQAICCRCAMTRHKSDAINNTGNGNHECRDIDDVIADARKQYGDDAANSDVTLQTKRRILKEITEGKEKTLG